MSHDPTVLPEDLPRPEDDGAAAHLSGMWVPSVALAATGGRLVDVSRRSEDSAVVLFVYPRTGRPGVAPPPGWDSIPGARGCTPEACAFRDLAAEFQPRRAVIYGLSTQDPQDQQEAATRLLLPYPLLSDTRLELASALRLPTFTVEGMTLLRRLTLVIRDRRVRHVLYPVFPPDQAAFEVLAVLDREQSGSDTRD
jgi:peroxiredoxin